MKLIAKTSLNFISTSIFVLLIGSFIFYLLLRTTINDSLKTELLSQKKQLISKFDNYHTKLKNPKTEQNIIIIKQVKGNIIKDDFYSDTIIYNESARKYVLYKQLKTYVSVKNKNFSIHILKSQEFTDKLIVKMILIMSFLLISFFISLYILNRYIIQNSFSVFYDTINKLLKFDVNKAAKLELKKSDIYEFQHLNKVLKSMTEKIHNDYINLKEYTENTSHEIQTPLAIINNKIEILLQSENLNNKQLENIVSIYEAANRLSKLNKTLIFLAKIDKRQFLETSKIELKEIINKNLSFFEELYELKDINIECDYKTNTSIDMNQVLAETLIQNLIKNAIKHNFNKGKIYITLSENTLIVKNTGKSPSKSPKELFERFSKSNSKSESLGIGLAIVKKICEVSDIQVEYKYENNLHILHLIFKNINLE